MSIRSARRWDEEAQECIQLKRFAKNKYKMKRAEEAKQGDTL